MTFVHNKVGKPIAKGGCKDDGVMAFGIALQVDEIAPLEERARKAKVLELRDAVELLMMEPKKRAIPTVEEICLATVIENKASLGGEVDEWEEIGEWL